MKRITLGLTVVVLFVFGISTTQAQDSTPEATPIVQVAAYVPSMPLPASAHLTGMTMVYQDFNRCSAAALTMQLSYFGWKGTYSDTMRALNPNSDDVAVRLDEMAAFAEQQGLSAVFHNGGTLDLLKRLVAGGFPVLIENVYYDGPGAFKDWMAHNRVIMGYDDAKQELYSYDSLLGDGDGHTGRPIPYAEIDERWRPFNRDFLVLYHPEDETKVKQILGNYWDDAYGNEISLQLSQAELDSGKSDSFTLFNMGSSLVDLGHYADAADDFDKARKIGLPWRMMWYQYGPFEAYLQVGRYDDVIALAHDVIATTPGVEETYYYAGLAYKAQGDVTRAKSNFEVAVWRNSDFTAAKTALSSVGG